MRKYLITGVLALAAGGFLTSCHDTEGAYSSIVEQKLQAYEQVFKEEFGEIDPNQDWGFGETSMSARIRTRAEGDEHWGDGNTNHNLWGDPNADGGAWNYDVPPALTEDQKLRVYRYFQTHPNLTYVTPPIDDYFVQQVYKGGYAPLGSLENPNEYSAEVYPTGNAQNTMGSGHMDWLTVTSSNKHVNDFNNGNYDGGKTTTVLNTGESTNNITDQTTHQDQITLMLDARPDCVGYSVSNGSVHHNNCAALVAAKIIDDWALDPNNYENGSPIGDNVWYDDPTKDLVNQKWNRSFVGLDYEQLSPQQCYQNEIGSDYQPIPGTVAYVKVDDVRQANYFRMTVIENDQKVTKIISKAEYKSTYGEFLLDKNNKKIPYISRKSNEICGTNVDFKNQSDYMPRVDCTSAGGGSDEQILDIDLIWGKLAINALPCYDADLKNWIKDIGGRDYVFSDWIVTLTPAKKVGSPDTQVIPIITNNDETTTSGWHQEGYIVEYENSGRVFCEDLGVVRASDIDFNDLVFDAYIFKKTPVTRYWKKDSNGNMEYWKDEPRSGSVEHYAEVYLLAAGGTLDLTISGKKDDETIVGTTSVKPYMKVGKTTILNTIMPNGETYGNNPDNKDQAPEKLVFEGVSSIANISIVVFYKSEDQMTALELEAFKGAAPHKLCVPIDTQWPIERAEVNLAYPYFTNYVKGVDQNGKKFIDTGGRYTNDGKSYYEIVNDLWSDGDPDYIYTKTVSYPIPDTSQRFESTGLVYEDQSTTTTGGYNGETILVRRRN